MAKNPAKLARQFSPCVHEPLPWHVSRFTERAFDPERGNQTCLSSLILCTVLGLGDSTVASHHPVLVDRQSGTNAGIVGGD